MNRQRPRLKNGVDLQLQSAFQDGNWPVVIRLAEKRAKTLNDQYYEVRASPGTELERWIPEAWNNSNYRHKSLG